MNRELTSDEARDQRTLLKILERNKTEQWLGGGEYWLTVVKQIEAMQQAGTTDGEELAELSDEDAKGRPWVMVRDEKYDSWTGPTSLLAAPPRTARYVVLDKIGLSFWDEARRATENELKQAGITE